MGGLVAGIAPPGGDAASAAPPLQACHSRQAGDTLAGDGDPLLAQFDLHARCAICAAEGRMDGANTLYELLILTGPD